MDFFSQRDVDNGCHGGFTGSLTQIFLGNQTNFLGSKILSFLIWSLNTKSGQADWKKIFCKNAKKGPSINRVDMEGGGGVSQMSITTYVSQKKLCELACECALLWPFNADYITLLCKESVTFLIYWCSYQ